MKIYLFPLIALVGCSTSQNQSSEIEKKEWHQTYYFSQKKEPLSLPQIELKEIRKIHIGDQIDQIEEITGFQAVQVYYDVDFSVVIASDGDRIWEVAFKHNGQNEITDISYIELIDGISDPFSN